MISITDEDSGYFILGRIMGTNQIALTAFKASYSFICSLIIWTMEAMNDPNQDNWVPYIKIEPVLNCRCWNDRCSLFLVTSFIPMIISKALGERCFQVETLFSVWPWTAIVLEQFGVMQRFYFLSIQMRLPLIMCIWWNPLRLIHNSSISTSASIHKACSRKSSCLWG